MRKFGQAYQAELNRVSEELLVAKKAQETFLRPVLYKEGRDAGQRSISMLNDVK
jgi:hypothetical protein